jgi:hypothetical protein
LVKSNARNQHLIEEANAIESIAPAVRVVFAEDDLRSRFRETILCWLRCSLPLFNSRTKVKITNAWGIAHLDMLTQESETME